jgi:nicotinamide riboside kinase
MLKIIVTGPESSGKTILCTKLAKHFNFSFTTEFARAYIDNLNRDYQQADLLIIAKGQLQFELDSQLLDTDLITIKIWSEYKYGNCDKWIIEQIEKQKKEKRFYLLCKADIPWEGDPQRENPNDRVELFEIYKQELDNLGHNYFIVEGENRIENSISKISSLITII